MMLAALTLASLGILAQASDLCPPSCHCFDNLTTVVCQDKGLSQIPRLPAGTFKLFISNNQIKEIPERGLKELQVWSFALMFPDICNTFWGLLVRGFCCVLYTSTESITV
ncbi:hypothetical protein XENOCAPTIV_022694 [Xenoophorus captivus]|uniref:LRRNT domain-containing protein n=2 Tax=Goodeidae TaxID=28758 RepID=A0ABV0R2T8_9TELE